MPFTKRISIERYKNADEVGSAGLIEGETEDGERWIIFMDAKGKPSIYWPRRDEDGAVVGNALVLHDHPFPDVYEALKPQEGEEIVSTFPVWEDGMRGILFGIVPSDTSIDEREALPCAQISRLLGRLSHDWTTDRAKDGGGDFEQASASHFKMVEEAAPERDQPIE
jgi:hypothetical protein